MANARVGRWRQEALCAAGTGIDAPSANRRSSERFQGKNGRMSASGLPPAVAPKTGRANLHWVFRPNYREDILRSPLEYQDHSESLSSRNDGGNGAASEKP